jgi:hypothetical protein
MPEMPQDSKDVFEVARQRPNYRQTYDRYMEQGTELAGFTPSDLKKEQELLMEALRKTAADPEQYTKNDRRELTEMLAELDAAQELHNQEMTMGEGRKPSKEPKGEFSDVERRNMGLLDTMESVFRSRDPEPEASSTSEPAKKEPGPSEEKETEMRDARRRELLQSLERFAPNYRELQRAERRQDRAIDSGGVLKYASEPIMDTIQ